MKNEIVYLDLFSGTGGFAIGLKQAGFIFKKHYFSEIDKHAIANTKYNFKNAIHVGAIEKIKTQKIERPNIITFGSPCQDISVASGGKGIQGSKSKLFFKAIEIIKRLKPDCFIFENVRNILSSNEGKDFETVLRSIAEIGLYDCQWQLLNSSLVLPQNRERLYLVGHLAEKRVPKIFPIQIDSKTIGTLREKESLQIIGKAYKSKQSGRIFSTKGKAPTLMTDGSILFIQHGKTNRKLTPLEAERIQGFPDNWTRLGIEQNGTYEISDTQRYALIGNAVSPNVVKMIADKLSSSNSLDGIKKITSNNSNETAFVSELGLMIRTNQKVTRLITEKMGRKHWINDKTEVKELVEFTYVETARAIANGKSSLEQKYWEIVALYYSQPNLSHRNSTSVLLNQYSTSLPIAFLMGAFCNLEKGVKTFEPSAGNGALTIAGKPEQFYINEIDAFRLKNLNRTFNHVTSHDASMSFGVSLYHQFDAVIMNPPFARLDKARFFLDTKITALDHLMVLNALLTMKDSGKAAILIGGHTQFDSSGRILKTRGRFFYNYLYHYFNVKDVIFIDGQKLYAKQGTGFPLSLILIDGRKKNPVGVAPLQASTNLEVIETFDALLQRVTSNMKPMKKKWTLQELELMAEELLADGLGAPYIPASESCVVLDTQVPDSMAFEMHNAVQRIKANVGGDVDNFVRHRLGYRTKMELCKVLSAEQIDAVAMCIYNIEGLAQATIIGDQTGIGKGRVAASMIRYAHHNGITPIFITEKANLFSDLYRDLKAIGSAHLVPFIVNAKESKSDIKNENGKVIYSAMEKAQQQEAFKSKKIPNSFDLVCSTYSQFNSLKRPIKPNFLAQIAKGSIVIMDESHNASGLSTTGNVMRAFLNVAKGAVFLSATFAKRPENMPIYAMKTAISEASLSNEGLVHAITKGGVALQEILASQLVSEGQMIRRERTYEGVKVEYTTLVEKAQSDTAIADNITEIIREIILFQEEHVNPLVQTVDKILIAEGAQANITQGTQKAGADNMPYFSKVFNIINQMLFSIKAASVAEIAIQKLKEGKKPIIAFSSTMGSFVEQLNEESPSDAPVKADFSLVLQKGLDGVMRYTTTSFTGSQDYKFFDPIELSIEGQNEYYRIQNKINSISSGITISPIDVIIKMIEKAGYSVSEVTGRKLQLALNKDNTSGIIQNRKRENVNDAYRKFNDNEVDVLLINQSGSTGASAHAISTKKVSEREVKQRCMIVLQPELDINQEVQKRGRIHRTGQILKPEYEYVTSAIPAEQRLMMMLQKKLKSLDANTSSNQKQSNDILNVPDFLNKYGDEVVVEYLIENPQIDELLGFPLNVGGQKVKDGASHRVSGRVAVLSTKMQEEFYNDIRDRYDGLVEYLKQSGEYDLEVEELPLEAKTLSVSVLKIGIGGRTVFGTDTLLEKCEVNNLRKPFTATELNNMIEQAMQGQTTEMIQNSLQEDFDTYQQTDLQLKIDEITRKFDDKITNIQHDPIVLQAKKNDEKIDIEARKLELEKSKELSIEKKQNEHRSVKHFFDKLFSSFQVGGQYEFPEFTVEGNWKNSYSVFLGFVIDKKRTNPYAPSAVSLRFAIASSHKYVAMPASKKTEIYAILGASTIPAKVPKNQLLEKWQATIVESSASRTVRHIITGNILQVMDTFSGKLVSYTTHDGNVQKGLLMPDHFNSDKVLKGKVSVPILMGQKIISSMTVGSMIPASNEIAFARPNLDNWDMLVPASKSQGGNFYLNEDLLALVDGNNFNKVGSSMRGRIHQENLQSALMLLQNMGVVIQVTESIVDAVGLVFDKTQKQISIAPPPIEEKSRLLDHIFILELEAEALLVLQNQRKRKNKAA